MFSDQYWKIIDQFQFTQPCTTFSYVVLENQKEVCIGTTQYYRLYAGKTEIANNCNSFYVHDTYLLFTDHTNTLKFVDLHKLSNSKLIMNFNDDIFRPKLIFKWNQTRQK